MAFWKNMNVAGICVYKVRIKIWLEEYDEVKSLKT